MIVAEEAVDGRDAILAAAQHHPFVRHSLPPEQPVRGWRRDDALCWLLPATFPGPVGGALGAPNRAVELVTALTRDRLVDTGRWVHLPRFDPATLDDRLAGAAYEDWEFLWTSTAPPPQPGEERVVRLDETDHPALTALIERSYPASTVRPGSPRVVDWYGIRDGDQLIACGADCTRGDIGFLAGLTVAPEHRGRGLGAALTTGLTRTLSARYDLVALGVYLANTGALRLYRRLGYTDSLALTSVRLD
ncbi:GNAT family N-acetyltransferase [Micromonospora sp. FIMYZ51]|uniref:GNAT family N-acetyltransferase n=1 Tax=Micromonospora sp. FIMYZ51 TaxID=3051832 RepID=UPI00311E85C5